jgi:hypothetical protein
MYLCVLCGSQNKQRLFLFIALTGFYNRDGVCLLRGTDWVLKSDGYSFVLKGGRAHTHAGKTGARSDSGAGCSVKKRVVFTRSRSGKLACRAGGRLDSFNVTALELAHVCEPVGAGRLFEIPQSV